jgi:hypothetical protein
MNDLYFYDNSLRGSVWDKHTELRSNFRSLTLNGRDYKLPSDSYTYTSAVTKINDIFNTNKSIYWDKHDGVSLIDENTHDDNISFAEPFMEIFSALNLLIEKSFKDTADNKFHAGLKKIDSFHQRFFDGGWSQNQRFLNGLNNAQNLMNAWEIPDIWGYEWLDTCIANPNSKYHGLVSEIVNRTFPDANRASTWDIEWFYYLMGILTLSCHRYLLHLNRNGGMKMYGQVQDPLAPTTEPDPLFNYNKYNILDVEDDNTFIVLNNLLRPIGVLPNLVYQQESINDLSDKNANYIKFTINDLGLYNEGLLKIGNWLITKSDLDCKPNRWMISELKHDHLKNSIDITADEMSTIILSAIKNTRQTTFFLNQINELINIDFNGYQVFDPPSHDPTGAQYTIKRWIEYMHELSIGGDGTEYAKFQPKLEVDIINNPNSPYHGWFVDTLRIYQIKGKLVSYIFDESDLQEYTVSSKAEDVYSAYREVESNYNIAFDYEYNFNLDNNINYSDYNGQIAAGAGLWCRKWDKEHGYTDYENCPSSITSQLYHRNAMFISPFFPRDNLGFKIPKDTNMGHKHLLSIMKYNTGTEPDRSDADKERTYVDKTVYDERRKYYDTSVKQFNDKNYSSNASDYNITLSLINYIDRFGKTDIEVGDKVIININNNFMMSTVSKTSKRSDKLIDAKITIDTNYQPFLGGSSFINSGISSYDIDLDIFG